MRATLSAALALTLAVSTGAQAQTTPSGSYRLNPAGDLSAMLDCFEKEGKTLISAHRGGPSPGLPENGIETMDAILAGVPAIMEVDVARSSDGVHYLMHDYTLDRTTNGTGKANEVDWATIKELNLVDRAGWVTPYKVPSLKAALEWARGKTVLQLDFKRSANYAEVIKLVRETGMEDSVILIAYNLGQANELLELAPDMLLSLSISDLKELVAARYAGIPYKNIIAFTGTRIPRPGLYEELNDEDIEVIFGTLGRPDRSIDGQIDRLGADEHYAELAREGVDILATDRGREAAAALAKAKRLPVVGQCGVSRASGE